MTTSAGRSSADQQKTNGRRASPSAPPVANRTAALPIRRTSACACGGSCPRCERAASAGLAPDAAERVSAAEASSGARLPADVQDRFGSHLNTDLDHVRVHTGKPSQEAAAALAARAYTIGNDIHFAAAQYQPRTRDGERLLAHEVVHTVQQSGTTGAHGALSVSDPSD